MHRGARSGGSLVGKRAEPFLVVDSLAVTKDTVMDGWKKSLNKDVPAPSLSTP